MARPRCPECRSKRWHRDRASGLVVCEEGHVLQGYVQEDNEADPTSANVTRKRYVRKNKQKKATRTANPDFFHGPQLRFLYFQCAQLILRHQIRALIVHWQLPPELETIARDLWAMYVSLTDLENEPFKHLEHQALGESEDLAQNDPVADDPLQKYYDELSDSDEDLERDAEHRIAAEMDEDPDADQDEVGIKPDLNAGNSARSQKRKQPAKPGEAFNPAKKLRLQYTLVICYLSCLTLRVPILMKDLLDLASSYKITYLEPLKSLPADMRKHLEVFKTDTEFVHTHVLPVVGGPDHHVSSSFVHLVVAFARMLHVNYGIDFPDMNAAPVLWKSIQTLSLPPWFYATCRRILIRVDAPMGFPFTKESKTNGPGIFVRDYPDAALAASIVISCKLLWGLDGRTRIPTDDKDIAAALPRLDAWLETAETLLKRFPPTLVTKGQRTHDVKELSGAEIDDFLDMFEDNLLALEGRGVPALGTMRLPNPLGTIADRFFPLPPRDKPQLQPASVYTASDTAKFQDALRVFYSKMHPPLPGEATNDEPLFPGQQYKLYKLAGDHQGAIDRDLARVLALVAEVTGLTVLEIERTTRRMEIRLANAVLGKHANQGANGEPNTLPWEGYESRQYAQPRARGGHINPPVLASSFRPQPDQKEPAVLAPKVVGRKQ